ncbi:MAG: alpha/beta fold hydrolase [Phycisphaerales bacterium]|nr:alpha/beta fold hydrolase [Phycisphaerales bacterium]
MSDRFSSLPSSLERVATHAELAGVPAMLAIPENDRPSPLVLWMHGRTAHKELDPGRYLRWIRSGVAACALDLPGHGERLDEDLQKPDRTLDVLAQMFDEIDGVLDALRAHELAPSIDFERLGIGGMSAGGMAALRRLCDEHPFRCAAVEATTGWLGELYHPKLPDNPGRPWPVDHDPERISPLDPYEHLEGWRPIPLLALHSEADELVPLAGQRVFIERVRERYTGLGADPERVTLKTWDRTGAPSEHIGFGKMSNEAKNLQTDFFTEHLFRDGLGDLPND